MFPWYLYFLEESSSLSHSVVFLYFFALIAEEGFLISPCYSLELCIQMLISIQLLRLFLKYVMIHLMSVKMWGKQEHPCRYRSISICSLKPPVFTGDFNMKKQKCLSGSTICSAAFYFSKYISCHISAKPISNCCTEPFQSIISIIHCVFFLKV